MGTRSYDCRLCLANQRCYIKKTIANCIDRQISIDCAKMYKRGGGVLNAYFRRSEFSCKCGCGWDVVDVEMFDILTEARHCFESQLHITSGCRCIAHNKAVGGRAGSYHIRGQAVDHRVAGVTAQKLYGYYDKKYPKKYGLYIINESTVHLDIRSKRWRSQTGGGVA